MRFLEDQVGLPKGSYVLKSSSGYPNVNKLSPRQLVGVLQYMHHQPALFPEYADSLAVAGGSGTLRNRMKDNHASAVLRAKTGSLSVASCLSGYLFTPSGQVLAFAFMFNDFKTGVQDVWALQDSLGDALANAALVPLTQTAPSRATSAKLD